MLFTMFFCCGNYFSAGEPYPKDTHGGKRGETEAGLNCPRELQ